MKYLDQEYSDAANRASPDEDLLQIDAWARKWPACRFTWRARTLRSEPPL